MRSIRTSKIETFWRKIETFLDGVSYLIEIQKKKFVWKMDCVEHTANFSFYSSSI